jgi:hypothetical protein
MKTPFGSSYASIPGVPAYYQWGAGLSRDDQLLNHALTLADGRTLYEESGIAPGVVAERGYEAGWVREPN